MHLTPLFYKIAKCKAPLVIDQGGASSSKTISHLQLFYLMAQKHQGKIFSVVSESLPHLKKGAIRDFKNIVLGPNWDVKNWNATDHIYNVGASMIEFFSCDNPEKARGPRRDYLYINEMDRISFDTFVNLEMRTNVRTYGDYNPVREFYYHDMLKGTDHDYIQSTYNDNDTLNAKTIKSIEDLQNIDPNKWKVFGLGELGYSDSIIYPNINTCNEFPDTDNIAYGLDFGYNHPCALVKCAEVDSKYWSDQLIYESHLTTAQLIDRMKQIIPNKSKEIFADSARPDTIQEIKLAGFNIKAANKDVKEGINAVKTKNPIITKRSVDLIKERKNYSWKTTSDGKILDEPVKLMDDAVDAERYCIYSWTKAEIKTVRPISFTRQRR